LEHALDGTTLQRTSVQIKTAQRKAGSSLPPYLVAIGLVAVATIIRGPILGWALGAEAPRSIFAAAVAIAAWYGGFKPGVLATVLALVLGTYFFVDHHLIPTKTADRERIVMFLGEGVMISWLFEEMRRARGRAEQKHRQLEEEMKLRSSAEAELVAANERKDVFVAAVAHELRNPLGPIRNAIGIMQAAGEDRAAAENARQIIERQVDQMVRLIDDLMDLSRVGRGKLQLHREQIELATVVERAIETCGPLVDAAGHHLSVSLPAEPLVLDADPGRLIQVFCNLLSNAAKYTERGGEISLRAEQQDGSAVVRISDTGIGIPPEALPSIFEMFVQVDDGAKRQQDGLGIGLALVRRLVRLHGGSVEARSAGRGKGSEFVVRLPLVTEANVKRTTTCGSQKL
jgi:signal transduction histidine kinase